MAEEQKITRKLRAILSADVKGYSLLIADDEAYTIKKLEEYRTRMSNLIAANSGRVVDAVGDNLLAEFSSAVDAVRCATEIQQALKEKNAEIPEGKQLHFRIGINIGDVVQNSGRIYGSGVNVAARIEGLAKPGGICISRNVYDQIKDKLTLGYRYLGDHEVKNIKDLVRVYQVLMDSADAGKLIGEKPKTVVKNWLWAIIVIAAIVITSIVWQVYQHILTPEFDPASTEKMAYLLPEKPSIAVLAFENMTGDPSQEYFSDGIAEEIITVLSMVDELFVIARDSSFSYKGKPFKIKQVSEDLGVRYVLEGSVRKTGNQVRVTAQLIDAIKGQHLWAESYDRDFDNIFKVQDEISMKIVSSLRVELTEGEQARIIYSNNINPEVYKKHLQAQANFRDGTEEGLIRYGQLAQEIVDIAPESEIGYMSLGWYHYSLAMRGMSPRENVKKSFNYAQKAISINESNGFSQGLLSYIYLLMKKYEKAIESGKRSVELQPNGATAYVCLGSTLGYAGHLDEAIAHLKQAIRLNPFPPYMYYYHLGLCYLLKGQFDNALTEFKKANLRAPEWAIGYLFLSITYIYLDRYEEARVSAAKALELSPNLSVSHILKISKLKNQAHNQIIVDAMRKAGFPEHLSDNEP